MYLSHKTNHWVGAGFLAALCFVSAGAGAAPDGPRGNQGCGQDWHGPPGPPGPPGLPRGFGDDHPPPFLMDMTLSEDQQDKVFAILHAAAPALREHAKAAQKAREALHDLGQSADFDAGKASTLAQAQAGVESQLSVLRARADHDIYLVLTQEQRAHIAERQHERASQPHDGPPPPR